MKTLKLIDDFLHILEQSAEGEIPEVDATEVIEPDMSAAELTSEGEKYLVDLLVKAFAHSPSDEELKIVDGVNRKLKETNPKEVAETIERFLSGSDEAMMDVLQQA
jgi:hypothetical protein